MHILSYAADKDHLACYAHKRVDSKRLDRVRNSGNSATFLLASVKRVRSPLGDCEKRRVHPRKMAAAQECGRRKEILI
jgi:hypothetical protein